MPRGWRRIPQENWKDVFNGQIMADKDWINPSVNKDFQAWAEHNGTVIMPAKVRKPRWKPNVEGHVKIVTMHILVEMDEMTFYSLDELNAVLWQKMEQENREPFQGALPGPRLFQKGFVRVRGKGCPAPVAGYAV